MYGFIFYLGFCGCQDQNHPSIQADVIFENIDEQRILPQQDLNKQRAFFSFLLTNTVPTLTGYIKNIIVFRGNTEETDRENLFKSTAEQSYEELCRSSFDQTTRQFLTEFPNFDSAEKFARKFSNGRINMSVEHALLLHHLGCQAQQEGDLLSSQKLWMQAFIILEFKGNCDVYRCYECFGNLYQNKEYHLKAWTLARQYLPPNSEDLLRLKNKVSFSDRCLLSLKNFRAKFLKTA